ncbi:MAG: helix-turn-helix transcriptional regulator [Dechloromonas sp.]|nr:MAG: helix-turn-helix transcriptional regulator [Dechloromonas sp.]
MLKKGLKPAAGTLGRRLREARLSAGLTQDALGVAIGLDEGPACIRISRYESGVHQPGLDVLSQLAEALNVPAFLVTENDQLAQAILYLSRLAKDDRQQLDDLLAGWES